MTELIKLEIPELVAVPPEGFVNVFYTEEDGLIVKKGKFHDGTVKTLAEECDPVEPDDPTGPFTITAKEANTVVSLNETRTVTGTDLYYSLNGGEWTSYTFGKSVSLASKGNFVRFWNKTNSFSLGFATYLRFGIDKDVSFSGNIMSLLNFSNKCSVYCFSHLFYQCTSLTSAPELPATELAEGCYYFMFAECDSLVTAPDLPATQLAEECYAYMFYYCTSLTEAPELPATELAKRCYFSMFTGCTSLTSALELPATELAESCYNGMFGACHNLFNIKVYFTEWGTAEDLVYYTDRWVNRVASFGTFYKPSALPEEYGVSRIPEGWTVVNID